MPNSITFSSVLGVNSEDRRLVDHAMDKPWAIGIHMATVDIVHIELQWTS